MIKWPILLEDIKSKQTYNYLQSFKTYVVYIDREKEKNQQIHIL